MESLEYRVDNKQALAYLQERHREFLDGVIIEEGDEEGDADDGGAV